MKTAEEWQKLYPLMVLKEVRAIQADALRHAASVAERICNQRDRLVTGELIGDTLLAAADKLQPGKAQ